MICNKCNHKLPDDSEFCQYCGSKIETIAVAEPVKEELPDVENMSGEEALKFIMATQVKATKEAYDANSQSQPNNENDDNFGLVPEKPIYTLARKSVDGEIEYLSKLRTPDGQKVKWNRRGSTSVDGVHGMIDIYDIYRLSGQKYCTIYINMYGAKPSTKMPKGFGVQKSQPVNRTTSPQVKKLAPAKKPVWDLINIFVLIVPLILSIAGVDSSYYYEEVYASILVIGIITMIIKIITIVKFRSSIVFNSIISALYLIMIICSLASDEDFGPWIFIFTIYLFGCKLYKVIRLSIEKYHTTQSYKMKCYKKINLLNEYLEKGIISQEEFDNTRKQIVSKIR